MGEPQKGLWWLLLHLQVLVHAPAGSCSCFAFGGLLGCWDTGLLGCWVAVFPQGQKWLVAVKCLKLCFQLGQLQVSPWRHWGVTDSWWFLRERERQFSLRMLPLMNPPFCSRWPPHLQHKLHSVSYFKNKRHKIRKGVKKWAVHLGGVKGRSEEGTWSEFIVRHS